MFNQILLVIIPSVISYILGYRMNNVDICGKRLDELEKSIGVYNTIIDDMSKKIDTLKNEINKLEEELKSCIEKQDFEKAIEIRDQLQKLKP